MAANSPESRTAKVRSLPDTGANARRQASSTLRDKQRLLSEAQRIARMGGWRHDRSGRVLWSDEMYRIHGVVPRRFTPSIENVIPLIRSDDRAALQAWMTSAFAGDAMAELEFRVVRPDGSERFVRARIEAAYDKAGKVDYLTGTLQDVTDRREAEAAVRDAAARYRQLFEANPYPMLIYDQETLRFLAVNEAAVGRYGYQRDEFLGMTLNDIRLPEDVPPLYEVSGENDGLTRGLLWRNRLKDGRLIDMEVIAHTIDFHGRPAHVVLAHDVSERQRAAQQVLESREALRSLVQRLQRAQEDERTRLARDIHDELGQLLAGLKMDLRWIERKLSQPGVPIAVNALLDRTVAASALTDQTIVAVQKIAAELRPGALDQLGLAAALAQRARQFEQRSGMPCSVEVAEPAPVLDPAVAEELFYICQEALTNVARHAHATRTRIRLFSDAAGVRLEIEDDGVGIDPARAGTPRSLGLLGMRERAQHCGGTVRFESVSPRGTRVVAQVPPRAAAR